ncbi:MAG: choice-of-anchor V domain-containing protein [Bacteroidia bacterium]
MKKMQMALSALALIGIPTLLSNSNGPGGNRTGSPGSSGTCQSCHGGTADLGASLSVKITDKATSQEVSNWQADKTYTIQLISTGGASVKRGFQFTLVDANGKSQGTFSNAASKCNIYQAGSASVVGHSSPGDGSAWTCDWTAPSTGGTELTLYATSVCSNNNGGNGGDQFSQLSKVFAGSTSGVSSVEKFQDLQLLGNPCEGRVVWSRQVESAKLFNSQGQMVAEGSQCQELEARELPHGIYSLRLIDGPIRQNLPVVIR